jgi:predicted site-specific integrase-resolvase
MDTNTIHQRLMTMTDAMIMLHMSEKTLHRVIDAGRLHVVVSDRQSYLDEDEVQRYEEMKRQRLHRIIQASDARDALEHDSR